MGQYENSDGLDAVHITHGYSKDHRPDLKQVVLSLVVTGPSAMPLWMEPLDGNSSDKSSFPETIHQVRRFQQALDLDRSSSLWVADSALYTKDKLLKQEDIIWLTRVPETLSTAKQMVRLPDDDIDWQQIDKDYQIASFASDYGGVEQRWLLVHSAPAFERERATLEKNIERQQEQLDKALWHLSNETFRLRG